MIKYLRQWLACRRLNKIVASRAKCFDVEQYRRRRAAALKATRGDAFQARAVALRVEPSFTVSTASPLPSLSQERTVA